MWMIDAVGNRLSLEYDANDRLQAVIDKASSRSLSFHYNDDGLVEYISGPVTEAVTDSIWVSYDYDDDFNLVSVTYADGSGFNYAYTDENDVNNLTEKRNKANHLLNTWGYDNRDRVIENFSRDGKGVSIEYVSDAQVNVTDAYGKERQYFLTDVSCRKRVESVTSNQGSPVGAPYNTVLIILLRGFMMT